jgi:bifunctional non-homologous end joining protein LigD
MKALLVRELPQGNSGIYESKFGGYRALAFKTGQKVRLVSRNQKSFNESYPQLVTALKSLPAENAIIDGEIAALDESGRSSFQLLQNYGSDQKSPIVYYVFDMLSLGGEDLRSTPLVKRRRHLAALLKKAPAGVRFSEELRGSKDGLLQVAHQFQLEGLIAKKSDSLYETGRRRGSWVKVKLTQQQEFLIGGYTEPEGSRKHFGALLVGCYGQGGFLFAGRVGSGYTEKLLGELYRSLQKIRRPDCLFVNLPEEKRGRWGQGITPPVMKRCHWVEPKLVAQIKFTEWTSDDQLRQPVFLGLRADKPAREVVRE